MLTIFNTLGRKREKFIPLQKNMVRFYHCGPTVYWVQHIGNMRAMTMGDLIRRSLIYLGYDVDYVRNYTDFGHLTSDADEGEDKMAKGAKREGLTPEKVADKYIQIFEKDVASLNILDPSTKTRATDYLEEMIKMVQELLEKEYAYSTPEAIYFDISKFKTYTELSGRKLETNITGAGHGTVTNTSKKHPEDFALWFFKTGAHKNALQYWSSPFTSAEVKNGEGIPGWHIECSAMARAVLGTRLDIHMGGVEHISIHHPNEIAQSESANGEKYVNYWLHNEHLTVDGGKMSKSEGTSFSLQEITDKGFDPLDLRYFFLQAQYRSKQNFTWEALESSHTAYNRLKNHVATLQEDYKNGEINKQYQQKFIKALEDDFNIPKAVSILWDLIHSDSDDDDKLKTVLSFDEVLGLNLSESKIVDDIEVSNEVQILVDERLQAKKEKDFDKADTIRERIKKEYGFELEDTAEGTKVVRIS